MFGFFTQSAVWQLVAQSDFVSKLVLLGLFVVSVICCAIISYKWMYLRHARKQLMALRTALKQARSLNDLVLIGKEYGQTSGGRFLTQLLTELKGIMEGMAQHEKLGVFQEPVKLGRLSSYDLEYIDAIISQTMDQILMEEECYLPVLSISAASAPLVGLFGTVWGLIHSFISISQEKTADIAVVAPGIAEALITTLAGLVVAIPALVFFHYFSVQVRQIEQQLYGISDTFLNIVKRSFNA